MKKYGILALAMVLVFSLFACKELATIKAQFIQSGEYFGLGAYVDKTLYIAVEDNQEEDWIFLDKWNAFDGDHTVYYIMQEDESLAGLKYVKRSGMQVPVGWTPETGILVFNNPFLYAYEEIPGRQWKKEVKEIGVILLKDPMGIMEAQMLLAQDLGFIETAQDI